MLNLGKQQKTKVPKNQNFSALLLFILFCCIQCRDQDFFDFETIVQQGIPFFFSDVTAQNEQTEPILCLRSFFEGNLQFGYKIGLTDTINASLALAPMEVALRMICFAIIISCFSLVRYLLSFTIRAAKRRFFRAGGFLFSLFTSSNSHFKEQIIKNREERKNEAAQVRKSLLFLIYSLFFLLLCRFQPAPSGTPGAIRTRGLSLRRYRGKYERYPL